jgi:predicted metal-dependent hydrolase
MERIPSEINGARVVLTRSNRRRRTVSMTVRAPGRVIVHAPRHVPESTIAAFLKKRETWILRQIDRCEEASALRSTIGRTRSWPFLGQSMQHPEAPASVERWYRREAASYLQERVGAFAPAISVETPRVKITSARRRWGSCNAANVLSFPWRLMMLPPEVVDYIVVHELSHIKEKNHGPRFWRWVSTTLPSHAAHRQWLRDNQHLFSDLTHEQTQA